MTVPISTRTSPTGVIIPLYTYPTDLTWNLVVHVKTTHPSVPIIAIINPSSGPGTAIDSNFVAGITKLQNAGVIVLGYVHTKYAARAIATVKADIDFYKNWYNVDGINFDEMANTAGHEVYFSSLSQYAKSKGMKMTVGNPGMSTLTSYIDTVDNLSIYESSGLPTITMLSSRTSYSAYPKSKFSMIAFGINQLDTAFVAHASIYVGYLYITDNILPNPYDTLPVYFNNLVAALDTG
ncbi:MAG: hypothetical protein AUF73_01055 [Thaumarchaeota archaeon 13_1_20CM_2_39_11]|nr:MAG: hypothetical protein AUI59_01610 [Thaumarchaeota archaeon 13_1_40CM_2_39_13_1]OLE44638.1 MAG: hypothetical protein AUF73_01055 [Thaumarchaeota archaeon 13_1_20CM_2_39_11]